jgi:acyl carrier protein
MSISEKLEKYMFTEIVAKLGKKSLNPEEDLLEQGIIDSLGIVKLVSFMEEAFNLKIDDDEIIPENFQSLNSIAKLVEQKTTNK